MILGMIFANFYPNPNPEPPLMLKVLDRLGKKTSATAPTSSPALMVDTTQPISQLTSTQKQQAQAQLTQLQRQMKVLTDSVGSLEAQLGTTRPDETLEARLQAIAAQVQGISVSSSNLLPVGNNSSNQVTTVAESPFQTDKLRVTLPSDILFEQSNSLLRPEASLLLDKIVADLRNYPASTIRVAAYTDATQKADEDRELSFRRAKTVEQYLGRTLDNQYRWIVIGYGGTHPLMASDTPASQQRNRRIEIAAN
jgi:outer membrane protein OmpA-like peptidoglycan-associated protein